MYVVLQGTYSSFWRQDVRYFRHCVRLVPRVGGLERRSSTNQGKHGARQRYEARNKADDMRRSMVGVPFEWEAFGGRGGGLSEKRVLLPMSYCWIADHTSLGVLHGWSTF